MNNKVEPGLRDKERDRYTRRAWRVPHRVADYNYYKILSFMC